MLKTILIIDFDQADSHKIAIYLKNHGFDAVTESNADQGLQLFLQGKPDFVLVNVLMPHMSGADICKRIKGTSRGSLVPVYLLSPLATPTSISGKQSVADGTVPKPVDLGRLLGIIEHHLGPGEEPKPGGPTAKKESVRPDGVKTPKPKVEIVSPNSGKYRYQFPEHEAPRDEGSLRKTGMITLIQELAREPATGRLEIESDELTSSIRWNKGMIVGVSSPDLMHHLVKMGKLTRDDVQAVRRRKNQERMDTLDALRSLNFIPDEMLDRIVGTWRVRHLRTLATGESGLYRYFPGPVTGVIKIDPLVLLYHAVTARHDVAKLQNLIQARSDANESFHLKRDIVDEALTGEPSLARIVDSCRKGTTLGALFLQGGDALATLAGLYALMLLDRVEQRRVEKPVPERTPEAAPKPPVTEFQEPETTYDFDTEFRRFDEELASPKNSIETDFPATDVGPALPEAAEEPAPRPAPDVPAAKPTQPSSPKPPAPPPAAPRVPEKPVEIAEPFDEHFGGTSSVSKPSPINAGYTGAATPRREAPEEPLPEAPRSRAPIGTEELIDLGDEAVKEGVFNRAQEYYRLALLKEPEHVEAHVKLARAAFRNKYLSPFERLVESVQACKRAIALKPDFLPAYQTLAKVFEEDQPDIAKHFVKLALEQAPEHDEFRRTLRSLERRIASQR